ncbi:AMP-binding protein [Rhodococcus aerolatus]
MTAQHPTDLLDGLRRRGDAPALLTPDGTTTHAELAQRAARAGAALGPGRRLVVVAARSTPGTVAQLLGALAAGHVVLLAPADDPARLRDLVTTYDPDAVLEPSGALRLRTPATAPPRHALHPELALLLPTSGSTGTPKTVRLSRENLRSNARAIAEVLDVRSTDRAALTLPLHYCYGLSVLTSNLLAGAAVWLPGCSVADPGFVDAAAAAGATSLHAVPHTLELLERTGFADRTLPTLRYVTQAGGRLEPAAVRRWAGLGARAGWRFVVMYGQTEATARMAHLPAHLLPAAAGAVGVAIPGGSLEVRDPGPDGTGDVVYRGPNVMLGYATGPADLARGRDVTELVTGDRGRLRPDGLLEVTGRRDRVVKPFGIRVDLDELARDLSRPGAPVAVAGSAAGLVLAVRGDDPAPVRAAAAARTGLPPAHLRAVAVAELPRTAAGKVDHAAVAALGAGRERTPTTVRGVLEDVFDEADLPGDASFTSLGGDSLSYVRTAVGLERVLGRVPAGWADTPLAELERLTPRRGRVSVVEPALVLRALAVLTIVASHVGLVHVLGGAHLLLAVSGWVLARVVLRPGLPGRSRAVLRSAAHVAVPAALWVGLRSLTEPDVDPVNALLVNVVLDPEAWGYWFVETLPQVLLAVAALWAVPAFRRAERAQPFGAALAVLAATTALAWGWRLLVVADDPFDGRLFSPWLVAWLVALGWTVERAATTRQRLVVAAAVLALVPPFLAAPGSTAPWLATAGVLALLAPGVPVPRVAVRPLGLLAGASLAVYLTHHAVFPPLLAAGVPPLVVVAACLAVGVAVTALLTRLRPAARARALGATLVPARRGPRTARAAITPARS